jgi:hypothetical protein
VGEPGVCGLPKVLPSSQNQHVSNNSLSASSRDTRRFLARPVNDDQSNKTPRRTSKRFPRAILAFLWLTLGYGFVSIFLPLVLLLFPFAHSGGGIEVSAEQGVHHVRFPGSPDDVIAVLFVTNSGPKDISYSTPPDASLSGSEHMQFSNAFLQLLLVAFFALVSIPVLRWVFRNEPGNV